MIASSNPGTSTALAIALRWSGVFEKYVLSFLFLGTALEAASGMRVFFERLGSAPVAPIVAAQLPYLLQSALVILYSLFFGLTLLFNRRPFQNARNWREIAVPLIATLLPYSIATLTARMPEVATRNMIPMHLRNTALVAAFVISIVGYLLALWALAYLGRSLSVVVSMRSIVLHGPYRYVRHPMYLAYLVVVLGLVVAHASPFSIVLFVSYVGLTVWRARLEEEMLCSLSDEYRQYAARTGFLFPTAHRQ